MNNAVAARARKKGGRRDSSVFHRPAKPCASFSIGDFENLQIAGCE